MSNAATFENQIQLDSRALIHPTAKIGNNVSIGPWSVIGPNVKIGDNTKIHSHVVIDCNTQLGENNVIHSYAALGGDPQDLSYRGEDTHLNIGDHNIIREFVTINRGSASGSGVTSIGSKNSFLAYSHVAHDCHLKDNILMVNSATLAGHVVVHDYVILGAFTAVHQFCRVGAYSFLSRATEVSKDIPPYMLVKGLPGFPCGLNTVGLKRHGFSEKALQGLKKAYQIMYRRSLKFDDVKKELAELSKTYVEVERIIDLINESKRGIARRSIE